MVSLDKKIIRVRHYTSPYGLAGIIKDCAIAPSRSGGVDVELQLFGTTRLGRIDSPIRRTGAAGEGAYVEFDAYPDYDNIILTPYVGPSNTATIVTPIPLSLTSRHAKYVERSWWQKFWDELFREI